MCKYSEQVQKFLVILNWFVQQFKEGVAIVNEKIMYILTQDR